jgi:hypothetical protein
MVDKLSVQSMITLFDNMSYEDEELLYYKIIKNKINFYSIQISSIPHYYFRTYIVARSKEKAIDKFINLINLKNIKTYLVWTKEYIPFTEPIKCRICDNRLSKKDGNDHFHEETEDDIIKYIRANLRIKEYTYN